MRDGRTKMKNNAGVIAVCSENADFQKFTVLRTNRNKRYKYGEFFVEGVRNINEAVKNGWAISSFIYSSERKLSDWARGMLSGVKTTVNYALTDSLMTKLSGKEDTSELLAVVKMRPDSFETLKLPENPLLLLFDRPSNRGNLGTVIRSADALGVNAVIITGHAVDLYDPEVVTAGMGSFFNVPVIRLSDNAEIEKTILWLCKRYPGFKTIATTAHKQSAIYENNLTGPCMLMIGNETDGLCRSLYGLASHTVSIPMAESSFASSFNVACAATVMLYEVVRQRTAAVQPNE